MKEKCTGDLRQELMSRADLDQYIKDNEECFMTGNVAAMLTGFYQKKNFSKAELARRAGMSEVYLHQTFSGRRRPSRDRLLCLCIGSRRAMPRSTPNGSGTLLSSTASSIILR